MAPSSSRLRGIPLLLVVLVMFSGVAVLAFQGGGPASRVGHSSDEVSFEWQRVTVDCTGNTAKNCIAACPASAANIQYSILSGGCISANALKWEIIGMCDNGEICAPNVNSWFCRDQSHVQNKRFMAYALCVKGGV